MKARLATFCHIESDSPTEKDGPPRDLAKQQINWTRERMITLAAICVTVVATILLARDMAGIIGESTRAGTRWPVAAQLFFSAIFLFLIYGNLLYQWTRFGYFCRLRKHRSASPAMLDAIYRDSEAPAVAMLVPSYKEEIAVVRQSLLSCALQTYPNRHVVLLIDDPYQPTSLDDRTALERLRRLPGEVQALLDAPAALCRTAYEKFRGRMIAANPSVQDE